MSPKVLVANRGEIAIRIFRAASELGWSTVAIYTDTDTSHATYADEAVKLESVADFLNVGAIVNIAYRTHCTHVHPGYGFLSESPSLPLALSKSRAGGRVVTFIGPSASTLRIASDKMLSRELAISLNIPVAAGRHVSSTDDVRAFANESQSHGHDHDLRNVGYPLMIKALDGGGGRGIRVVHSQDEVEDAFKRCLGESPSKQVFVEKALTGSGWKHIEVQVIGDGVSVNHFWERECSVQRRFQKIVEIAPSRLPRTAVQPIIDASLKMAHRLQYKGLGTFEFLVNAQSPTSSWVFLEINPRVQVEHTITEEISNIDLVRAQLLLFSPSPSPSSSSSSTIQHVTLSSLSPTTPPPPPTSYAIQLRLNAEDPLRGFQLSPGVLRARDVLWPAGRGVRVDTWLSTRSAASIPERDGDAEEVRWHVGTEFDSLLAKIIVRGRTLEEVTRKGICALRELRVGGAGVDGAGANGVRTNVFVLAGTLVHPDWMGMSGEIDTLWLERNLKDVIKLGGEAIKRKRVHGLQLQNQNQIARGSTGEGGVGGGSTGVLLQPGSLFHLTMSPPPSEDSESTQNTVKRAITITSIGQNAFPSVLSGTFLSTLPSPFSSHTSSQPSSASIPTLTPTPISFTLSQSTSASVTSDDGLGRQFELADPNAAGHISSPMTGKIVELHPALVQAQKAASTTASTQSQGKIKVRRGEALLVLSVMKMENVVAAPCDGYVQRVGRGVSAGVVLGESMLVCVLELDDLERAGSSDSSAGLPQARL